MDAARRSFKTIRRCRKGIWKSLKTTRLLSCCRRGTSERTADDTPYGVTAIAVETLTSRQESTATEIDGRSEVERFPAMASSKTEEGIEHGTSDNGTVSRHDPSPNGPTEGTATVETARVGGVAAIDGPDESDRIRADAISKKEIGDTHGVEMSVETRRKDVKSQDATKKRAVKWSTRWPTPFVEVDVTKSRRPSQNNPIGGTASAESDRVPADATNANVALDKCKDAWVPTVAAKRAVATDIESKTTEETGKGVRSILNKITSKNTNDMIMSFMALPINTVGRLERAVDLIFEKAIREQHYAPLYAVLCSAVKSVVVTDNNGTASFKNLVIKKCQSFFESDNVRRAAIARELEQIESCTDQEKKKELQYEHEENERRSRKRSVGNCCFIGELFNQHVVHPRIIQYCIAYLICQRSDEPMECLCKLLKTTGKQLEQWCDLNDTFDSLKTLTSVKSMSPRIRFMVQDVIDLRRRKWSPDH